MSDTLVKYYGISTYFNLNKQSTLLSVTYIISITNEIENYLKSRVVGF